MFSNSRSKIEVAFVEDKVLPRVFVRLHHSYLCLLIDGGTCNSKMSRFHIDDWNSTLAHSMIHLLALYLASIPILVGWFGCVACFDQPGKF